VRIPVGILGPNFATTTPLEHQTAEAMRVRCLEALELLGYLQAFSCLPGESELGRLPRLFTDDATMAEAAVRACRGRPGWRCQSLFMLLCTQVC
jgi:hypothetical protein